MDTENRDLERIAAALAQSRLQGGLIGTLPGVAELDQDTAYLIQDDLHQRLSRAGRGPLAGYKIGCTTAVMQAYLAIDQPCAGGVFANTVCRGSGQYPAPRRGRLGAECEIAVTLDADLVPENAPYDRAGVAGAVASCAAAIELVEDRYEDYSRLNAPVLIADDFFNAGCVLGEKVADWRRLDLAGLRGRMWVDGELRGEGRGADILGHPMQALVWLANRWAGLGRTLEAGRFILLGSVVQTQWLAAGEQVDIEIEGLGECRLTIA